jgi:hypothetical protein
LGEIFCGLEPMISVELALQELLHTFVDEEVN